MNAYRPLYTGDEPDSQNETFLIKVQAGEGSRIPFMGLLFGHGDCVARIVGTEMAFFHPGRERWVSRPLHGHGSWQTAWKNDQVDIYIFDHEWKPVEAWGQFTAFIAQFAS